LYLEILITIKIKIMKTFISLAVASILVFSSCKKSEIEEVKPYNPTSNSDVLPSAKLAQTENANAVRPADEKDNVDVNNSAY
jgi:hypothetical protein